MSATRPTPAAWSDSVWMRYGNRLTLLHDHRQPTARELTDAGIPAASADRYMSGCIHGTGYRGIYQRDYLVNEERS